MAEIQIRDAKGKAKGKHELSAAIAEANASEAVLHRVVVAEQANKRQGTQSVKTRSEAQGGGAKPYRQKKTGRARQGSIRAPHYAHGGMAHAVKPRDYDQKVNKKERRAALMTALKLRIDEDAVVVADKIEFKTPSTKDAVALLTALEVADAKRILVVIEDSAPTTVKSFRNLPNVEVRTRFSTRDLLLAGKVVIAKGALEKLEEEWKS